jgi:hypothetical protein
LSCTPEAIMIGACENQRGPAIRQRFGAALVLNMR